MNKAKPFFIAFLILACLPGCGPGIPKDLPKLYPLTLTILQDGKALPDANVALYPTDGSFSRWGQTGMTDSSGQLQLKTNNRYPGVPAGKYKVTVGKKVRDPNPHIQHASDHPESAEFQQYQKTERTLKTYTVLDLIHDSYETTPLEIEVVAGKNNFVLDTGKEVKIEMRNAP